MPEDQQVIPERFFAVSLEVIEQGSLLPCDVWLRHEGSEVVLYRSRDLPFDREHAERLASRGLKKLLIAFEDAQSWSDYIGRRLAEHTRDSSRPLTERLEAVIETSSEAMKQVFEDPAAPFVQHYVTHVSAAIATVMSEPEALAQAVQLMRHDYYTYTHCLQVSLYASALASACGVESDKLPSIGAGCLLHDIGKCDLPREVLNKPGRLDPAEWKLIRRHPSLGVKMLRSSGWKDPLALEIVACHHERLDGTGYPFGMRHREISLPVRVASVCDAFDAMTTDRSYERALRGVEALRIIRSKTGAYDQRVVATFVQSLLDPARTTHGSVLS